MARVLVAGVAVADFVFQVEELPLRAEKYRARDASIVCGGCAANAAISIARQGGHPMLAARIGADPVGDIVLAELESEGVDTSLVHRAQDGKSSFSSVYVDREGERQIMNFRGSGLAADATWLETVPDFDIVLADNRWSPLTRKAIEIAGRQGIQSVIDAEAPLEAEAIEQADRIAFSRQGLSALVDEPDSKKALQIARDRLGNWVCLTEGELGVRYFDDEQVQLIPSFKVDAVDTLAAGDVWHGVFALRLAEGDEEKKAMHFANAAAALKCTKFGGIEGAPDKAATERFLEEHSPCN